MNIAEGVRQEDAGQPCSKYHSRGWSNRPRATFLVRYRGSASFRELMCGVHARGYAKHAQKPGSPYLVEALS